MIKHYLVIVMRNDFKIFYGRGHFLYEFEAFFLKHEFEGVLR